MLRLHSYQYHRPGSIAEAAELLAAHPQDAMLIAGGTDVMPNMKHRLFTPNHLIAIRNLPELHGISTTSRELVIGAAETLTDISLSPLVLKYAPSLAQAAGSVAGPQLRNMGTIGGNICLDTRCTYYNQTYFWRSALGFCLKKHGDVCHVTKVGRKCVAAHSADTPPVLLTLGAVVDLVSAEGTRSVSVADFFVADGIWNSVRKPSEIVARVRVPLPAASVKLAFLKVRQRQSIDFPLLNMAIAADFDGRTMRSLRIVVSALGSKPRDLAGLDKVAAGRPLDAPTIEAIAERAYQQCHPLENIIVDPDWRHAMVPIYVKRALGTLV
ncbi:MAG TPA: FAD binding domain-containing protein [Longimicrobiales bacterium]